METQVVKTVQFGKYKATILSRPETVATFRDYPYSVKFIQETPKARYNPEKVIQHFVYKTYEKAEEQANAFVNSKKAQAERKEKERIAKREANKSVNAKEFYKEGDVIVNTWGNEQTNVNYYRVYKVTQKTISIIEINSSLVEGSLYSHGMAADYLPDVDSVVRDGDNFTLRVYEKGRLSNPEPFYYMRKWDGRPQYASWYY